MVSQSTNYSSLWDYSFFLPLCSIWSRISVTFNWHVLEVSFSMRVFSFYQDSPLYVSREQDGWASTRFRFNFLKLPFIFWSSVVICLTFKQYYYCHHTLNFLNPNVYMIVQYNWMLFSGDAFKHSSLLRKPCANCSKNWWRQLTH